MKKILTLSLFILVSGTSLYSANTEVLTKAMVKLITKQKTLENAIIVLKRNQNKSRGTRTRDSSSGRELNALNLEINELKREIYFAKNINKMKVSGNYKYKRNSKKISEIDSFISRNQ